MREAALFAVWIIGLFTLIGGVLAATARFVRRDSSAYDEQITWSRFPRNRERDRDRQPEGTSEILREDRRSEESLRSN